MATIPAPTLVLPREEWPDADFDLPEGQAIIHTPSDKDAEDEDWDIEMNFGSPTDSKPQTGVAHMVAKFESSSSKSHSQSHSQIFTIRPPHSLPDIGDDEEDEGTSTIKVAVLPKLPNKTPQSPIDEDFEDAFSLPSDLTQLSLAPLCIS